MSLSPFRRLAKPAPRLAMRVARGFLDAAQGVNHQHHGPSSDHFDGSRFYVQGHPSEGSLLRHLLWNFSGGAAIWPTSWPSPFHDRPPTRVGTKKLRVTLIGHASFLIQVSNRNILVDPVYSERASPVSFAGPKRVNPPGISFNELPPIDLVLISHGHYDHLDLQTLRRSQQMWAPHVVAPLGHEGIIGPSVGGRITTYDWGQSHDAGNGVTIHLEPSYHWSTRGLMDRQRALWCSFFITSRAGSIYHVADTGYGSGHFFQGTVKKHGRPKLAILPIGAYEPRWFLKDQHVNPAEAIKILSDCGAEHAIGHHWGTFQLTNEPIDQPEKDLKDALAKNGVDPKRFEAFRPGQVWSSSTG